MSSPTLSATFRDCPELRSPKLSAAFRDCPSVSSPILSAAFRDCPEVSSPKLSAAFRDCPGVSFYHGIDVDETLHSTKNNDMGKHMRFWYLLFASMKKSSLKCT